MCASLASTQAHAIASVRELFSDKLEVRSSGKLIFTLFQLSEIFAHSTSCSGRSSGTEVMHACADNRGSLYIAIAIINKSNTCYKANCLLVAFCDLRFLPVACMQLPYSVLWVV